MKLDAHPRSMALIMLAIGVSAIGIILTIAFFNTTVLLGVGITLAILGAAGAILGCIHRTSQEAKMTKKGKSAGPAPERIPSPSEIVHDGSFEGDPNGQLYYAPCSVSPPRIRGDATMMSPQTIIPRFGEGEGGVLSPYDQRSFPVPHGLLTDGFAVPRSAQRRETAPDWSPK